MFCKLSTISLSICAGFAHVGALREPPLHAAAASLSGCEDSQSLSNATAFAITYGYPLTSYVFSLESVITSIGPNAIYSESTVATAGNAPIVRPNVDTLYSKIAIDLSHNDVAITIPPIQNRFYVFPFYDLWSNNFANLGSISATKPGKYLVRLASDESQLGFQASTDQNDYLGYINFPTAYGLVLPRILLFNNLSDVNVVQHIQAQIKVVQVPRYGDPRAPRLTSQLLGNGTLAPLANLAPGALDANSIQKLLQVVAAVTPYNKPFSAQAAVTVQNKFSKAGISDGFYEAPPALNVTLTNELVNASLLTIHGLFQNFGNDWIDFIPAASGNFHQHYASRAFICYTGYLQLVHYEALYPQYIGSGIHGLFLEPDQSYILTFPSGKPAVEGFWSITAYNRRMRNLKIAQSDSLART